MESHLEIIKEQLDVLELASSLTTMKKSGRAYKGLCPFHQENTPSFYVWPEKGRFKCFGCGKFGTGIDLYMHIHDLTFQEAVKYWELKLGLVRKETIQPETQFCPLKSKDFHALSLHPKSMRTLYEEDRETYYLILSGKIKEHWAKWADLLNDPAIQGWKPEYKEIIKRRKEYYWDLWFSAFVKDKEKWRRSSKVS